MSGLGELRGEDRRAALRPFATQAAIKCTGTPYAVAEVYAKGDGTVRTPAVRVKDAGFYTYRLHLAGTDLIADTTTECPIASETALVRPLIITGRNDVTGSVAGPRPIRSSRRTCASRTSASTHRCRRPGST